MLQGSHGLWLGPWTKKLALDHGQKKFNVNYININIDINYPELNHSEPPIYSNMIGNEKIHIETLNDCIVFNDLLLQESQTKSYFWKVFLNMLGYISRHTIK